MSHNETPIAVSFMVSGRRTVSDDSWLPEVGGTGRFSVTSLPLGDVGLRRLVIPNHVVRQ